MTYVTVNVDVDVDVDLDQIETDDLVKELETRGIGTPNPEYANELLNKIYESRRLGKDFSKDLDALIYSVLGKIV